MTVIDRDADGSSRSPSWPYGAARRGVDEALARGWGLARIERAIDHELAPALSGEQRAALWLYAEAELGLHPRRHCVSP